MFEDEVKDRLAKSNSDEIFRTERDLLGSLSFTDGLLNQVTPTAILDREFRFVFANLAYCKAISRKADELVGNYIFDVFPETPDRVNAVLGKFELAADGLACKLDAQAFDLVDAVGRRTTRYWQVSQEPLHDPLGNLSWILIKINDVTEEHTAAKESKLAAQELDHRTKNVLAVIQSMMRLASRENVSKDEFATDLISRIGAMSRNHSRLYANDFQGMTVRNLLIEELSVIAQGDNYTLSGGDANLSSRMARDLSMVVHELATNAAKYGSFSTDTGHLSVCCDEVDDVLEIDWIETHDLPLGKLSDKGFGSKLLRMLRGIDVTITPQKSGLHIKIKCKDYKTESPLK